MVQKLRAGGRKGLLFANGGFATSNHTIVLSRTPAPLDAVLQDFDFQAEADAARGAAPPLNQEFQGPGEIETYTVLYERNGAPRFGVVVGRNAQGERFLAKVPASDEAGIAFLSDGKAEPIGTRGKAVAGPDGDALWKRA
jgi:acetyl-CoA C-acetyltransferase